MRYGHSAGNPELDARVQVWQPPAELDVDEALDLADEVLREIAELAEGDAHE